VPREEYKNTVLDSKFAGGKKERGIDAAAEKARKETTWPLRGGTLNGEGGARNPRKKSEWGKGRLHGGW